MKQHFIQVQCYQTKNKAHAKAQKYVAKYDDCLIDDVKLEELITAIHHQIEEINLAFLRCHDISLSTTSFTDGTKQSIEMDLVGNYFGMKVLKRGMVGPEVSDVKEVLTKFDWDNLPREGVVDYVIGKNLFPGIFVVVEHTDPNQKKYLRYLGLGEGPRYVLFEPYHLCHLEVLQTVVKVALFGQETINNSLNPINRTIAIAKQDLFAGQRLDGIGGDTVYGMVDSIENSEGLLPVGLSHHALVKHDIKKDTPIKVSDVVLPITIATRLTGYTKPQHRFQPVNSFFTRMINLF
ncbi:MAG: Oxidoreductase domain protein [Microgenomates group bacterium GW2011_GWC1_41_8]|nr:MAG: Oxidoreductase domain protein [Microgenomates group bacterium GW2011_GWC1_41_8]